MLNKKILLATSLSVLTLAYAQASYAQDQGQASEDEQQGGGISEIIVTAQKRAENVQDVPIAMTAITGETLKDSGIESADDMTLAVPSLTWQQTHNSSPYIRGVGKPIVTAGNESSVGIFVDGVLQISPLQANFAMDNVERIEVLKGPQGTLFGRNSNGGVISITTRAPSFDTQAEASIGYANYDTVEGKFYASGALGDELAANFSGSFYNQDKGWGKNIYNGDDAYWSKDWHARGKLLWEPDDDTSITLTGEYHYTKTQGNAYAAIAGTLAQDGTGSPGFYNLNSDFETYLRTRVAGANLRARHDMGWAELVSITAYTRVRTYWPYDSDGAPGFILQGPIYESVDGFTQEVQLVSPGTGNFRWVVGLYYMYMDAAFDPIELYGANVGGAKVEVFGATKANSFAGFGQATWEFVPDTNLTVGARMTFDKRSVSGHVDVNDAPGTVAKHSKNFSEPTYKVTLDHKFGRDFMVYATHSTGYNSGQFNTGNANAPAVNPEKIKAYEIGFKSQFLDNKFQLNGAAYHYDYRDLQVTVIENAVTVQTNAAKAKIDGFELEANVAPVRGLLISAAVAYSDARYSDYNNAQYYRPVMGGGYETYSDDATGNRLRLSNKWAFSASARYDIETEAGVFTPSVAYSHRGPFFWNDENTVKEPAHDVLNASLTFTTADDRFWLRIWGKNLFDEKIRASTTLRREVFGEVPAAPLTYGATLGWKM
ncbi:MAG: TonB-dependent receptor [Novosphingobium sp.]